MKLPCERMLRREEDLEPSLQCSAAFSGLEELEKVTKETEEVGGKPEETFLKESPVGSNAA